MAFQIYIRFEEVYLLLYQTPHKKIHFFVELSDAE